MKRPKVEIFSLTTKLYQKKKKKTTTTTKALGHDLVCAAHNFSGPNTFI